MKRDRALVAFLCLLIILTANPDMSSIPAAIVGEASEVKDFNISGDGDESSESITAFAETISDDILFFPDAFLNDTAVVASGGYVYEGDTPSGDYTNIQQMGVGSDYWVVTDSNPGEVNYSAYFATPSSIQVEGIRVAVYCMDSPALTHDVQDVMIRKDGGVWEDVGDIPSDMWGWVNFSQYSPDYWNSSYVEVALYLTNAASQSQGFWRYAEVTFYEMHLSDSDHYAESFADVSDWSTWVGNGISSDGDVGYVDVPADSSWDRVYTNVPSIADCQWMYLEFRVKGNVTGGGSGEVLMHTADDHGGTLTVLKGYTVYDYWVTYKIIIDENLAIESISLTFLITSGNRRVSFDYLRIGISTEMGWQHDGSTTEATVDLDGSGFSTIFSSDGDKLNVTMTKSSGTGTYNNARIDYDTTATICDLNNDNYPFYEVAWEVTTNTANTGALKIFPYISGYRRSDYGDILVSNGATGSGTERDNTNPYDVSTGSASGVTISWTLGAGETGSLTVLIDWVKYYSIANFSSITNTGNTGDYFYVDSNVLHCARATSTEMYIYYESGLLSVDTNTYNIWNCSLGSGDSSFGFGCWITGWENYDLGESRGGFVSGTLARFRIRGTSSFALSAIKFLSDGTAPDILDKFVNPVDPNDDEAVSFTAVTYDAVEVYKVTLNAVVYPDGFSDVDYEMTEQTTDVLWSYEFSTLVAGYYLFGVTANDGANTYSEYIPVTVRESAIVVEEITLIGAGSDFTMMQFSARINKDCSYVIYEESENNAESATHSGSVSEPSFNLAWTKLSTTDTNVNFTIRFTNGTLTYNYTSQYQVAQTVLSVTSYDWGLSESQVTISFQTSKGGTYTVYLNDVQDSTSSFVTGSNFLNWSRPSAVDPAEIDAAVKLTDGTTTIWLNQTYSEYSLTAFSIQTLFMDMTDPTVSAIFTTSWGNATGYLYEDDVQQDTAAEGITLSYSKSTIAGTYNVALKIDAGGEIAWYNTTYTVAVTTLQVTDDSIRTTASYAYLGGHVNLNANYTVYEETVQVGTGSVSAGSFEIRWTKASSSVENVTVLFESDSQTYPVYSGYDVAEQATFVVEQWWVSLQIGLESYVEFYAHTSWENATIYVYDNTTLMVTVSELAGGASSNFWMSEVQGLHTITLNITHGATVHTRTKTYFIPDWAVSGLSLRWSLYTFQDNYTMLSLESNWRNCSYSVYLNGSEVATSANDPVTLNFTRAINIGTYNLTIHADGGAQTYTVSNIRYIITEEGVTYDFSTVSGGRSVREGDVYVYEGDDVVINENPPGIYMTAETAATIAVSTVFIFFLAVLFMNSRVKKAQLDIDKKGNQ